MQMNTCARTLVWIQWWIGRRSRSMALSLDPPMLIGGVGGS